MIDPSFITRRESTSGMAEESVVLSAKMMTILRLSRKKTPLPAFRQEAVTTVLRQPLSAVS